MARRNRLSYNVPYRLCLGSLEVSDGQALVRLLAAPAVRDRADGFTVEKRRKFLKALARGGCISDAARIAGISTNTVGRWRDKDEAFVRRLAAALDKAGSEIGLLAWERVVTRIEEPVWHYGKRVGVRIRRSDAIFRMLLIASNPGKYGRMGAAAKPAKRKNFVRAGNGGKRPRTATNAEVKSELVKALAVFGARIKAEREAAARTVGEAGEDRDRGTGEGGPEGSPPENSARNAGPRDDSP